MAQRKLADTEADLKQAKDEAARATKEAQQEKADAQVARQSKAEAERKLAELEATERREQNQADPLGTWLRGLGAWLRVGLFGPPNPENP
jgi:chromosome segregation ATPase